jgi:hypothetical protein
MKCKYCGTDKQTGNICEKCGAPIMKKNVDVWKSDPFFYNGYICYTLRAQYEDTCEVQFWLGMELIERIKVSRQVLESHVPEYCDSMPFFWDLFLLAHGEKDVIKWQEKNNKYPATLEVRRIENPEKQRLWGLSMMDIVQEYR